ncbi:hypothetical protein HCX48_02760 [Rhodocyclus tenuis]|uniref:Uncharacterized protein n=1 Tax=Rhodocyclus gracilis TaxID=2929842 RepID=A0ABX0WI64_9RHOO|nr:hypothetical protein [Rhodocyclus gracilis]NJA88143.1 hypothetical protein [Rhodocyclus gracilis]
MAPHSAPARPHQRSLRSRLRRQIGLALTLAGALVVVGDTLPHLLA